MQNYLDLMHRILIEGEEREDRTGTGTYSLFGTQLEYDLQKGFPAVTSKKLWMKGVWVELEWFVKGMTNIKFLVDNGVNIWNKDAYRWYLECDGNPNVSMEQFVDLIKTNEQFAKQYGDIGPVYGSQWRNWNGEGVDQLGKAIHTIKNNPTDRRIMVSAWNPSRLGESALPPCHVLFQYYVRRGKYLDIQVYQRSADMFLGVPFDLASYATQVHEVCFLTGLIPGKMKYCMGDTHIYKNHVPQVLEQLRREPRDLPQLFIDPKGRTIKNIEDFQWQDFQLIGYNPHPAIKGELS